MTITIDTSRATELLKRLGEVSHRDSVEIVSDESKRLARTVATYLPPFGLGPSVRNIAYGAVAKDIGRLDSEATPKLIGEVQSRYGLTAINAAYVTQQSGQKLNLNWEHLDPEGQGLEQFHRDYRTPEGRIPGVHPREGTWSAHVVSPLGTRKPFTDKLQLRVGRWKASWALVCQRLGDKPFPSWISRHFGFVSQGLAIADLSRANDREHPQVIFGSRAPGNFRNLASIRKSVNVRVRAIRSRLKLLASGYSRSIAQGIRLEPGKTKSIASEGVE